MLFRSHILPKTVDPQFIETWPYHTTISTAGTLTYLSGLKNRYGQTCAGKHKGCIKSGDSGTHNRYINFCRRLIVKCRWTWCVAPPIGKVINVRQSSAPLIERISPSQPILFLTKLVICSFTDSKTFNSAVEYEF